MSLLSFMDMILRSHSFMKTEVGLLSGSESQHSSIRSSNDFNSSTPRLFVDADNLERLVMYFRRLGTKAAETKLRDLRSIY
ncbi:hypothetical protein MIR68_001159 [Amoeboaphelidium protococcarum]|nr:hypothetical protein MIR68_001159 [Amoeboaphelidium protococcarum]